jgi:hypothetical protein
VLKAIIESIMNMPDATHEHDLLRARACVLFGTFEPIDQMLLIEAREWGPKMAKALIKYSKAMRA